MLTTGDLRCAKLQSDHITSLIFLQLLDIPRPTQPSIPSRSVNEYQLQLGRQRQVWLIPIVDEHVGVQVKLVRSLENTCHS